MIGSCWGNKKQKIVEKYDIEPVAHFAVLPNQCVQGCCGKIKKTNYYAFNCTPKEGGDSTPFYVGLTCAQQFLDLLGLEKLPIFNPLKINKSKEVNSSNSIRSAQPREQWDALNLELYNAIHLLCIAWSGNPQSRLLNTVKYLRKNKPRRTQDFAINVFYEIVAKDCKGRSWVEIVDDLKREYSSMRDYSFELLEAKQEDLKSFL